MNRSSSSIQIEDRLDGSGRHRFLASFHLAPGWSVTPGEEGWTARSQEGGLILNFLWKRSPETKRTRVEDDLHSPSYGVTQNARTVRIEWEGDVPCRVRYEMTLQGASGPR